jgi:hypothetical protein
MGIYHRFRLAQMFSCLVVGRAALQKRIMVLLRKIEHCTTGVLQVSLGYEIKPIDICRESANII